MQHSPLKAEALGSFAGDTQGEAGTAEGYSTALARHCSTSTDAVQAPCIDNSHEIAWMAGFVDGEGCITISRQDRKNRPSPAYRAFITVCNTCETALTPFCERYGGKIYMIHENRTDERKVKWSDAYCWYCPITSSASFLQDILPYLRVKRQQAELCLEFLCRRSNTRQSRRGNGTFQGSDGLTSDELDKREQYRIAIKSLNGKSKQARLNAYEASKGALP